MIRSLTLLAPVAVLLATLSPLEAAKVKVWHHHQPADFQKSAMTQTVVSNEGVLRLSREMTLLADLQVMHIWDIAEDKNGNLWVATGGEEGKLIRVSPLGESRVVYTSNDSQILCVRTAADGSVFCGTGPGGQLVKIPSTGKPQVLAKDLGSYVWSLVVQEKQGTILAGTGPDGRIYECTLQGKTREFYQTKQDHVLCLAQDPAGQLYAGTDKGGLVYRIDAKGKGFVLYNTHQSEVRSLVVTAQGIYAGTGSPTKKIRSSLSATKSEPGTAAPKESSTLPVASKSSQTDAITKAVKTSTGPAGSSEEEQEFVKGTTAEPPVSPEFGENSLYRIAGDGTVRELFREKAMILTMLPEKGQFLIGTGMEGRLFEMNELSKEKTELARLDHGQIHCLVRRQDGSIVVGTGDPGKLYVLQKNYSQTGTVVSDVLDAKIQSRWGAAGWRSQLPAGTMMTVAFRSGNVPDVDETWSDWSEEQSDPERAKITCPAARYLQYRITLTSQNTARTPELYSLAIRYMTTNHPPEVLKVETPDLIAEDVEDAKKLKIQWKAVDPNEDELTFGIYVRKEGWNSWVCLKDNYGKTSFEWDPGTMPSGVYQVKIVASDALDNTADETCRAERVSTPFPVTTAAPKVSVRCVGFQDGKAILEASSEDAWVRLTKARFSVNGGTWEKVFPQDRLFDSPQEAFRFVTPELNPGTYVLVLRVGNAAGIYGSSDVVFTVPGKTQE